MNGRRRKFALDDHNHRLDIPIPQVCGKEDCYHSCNAPVSARINLKVNALRYRDGNRNSSLRANKFSYFMMHFI